MKSSSPSSAQWRSSNTSTSGRSRRAPRGSGATRRTPRCDDRHRLGLCAEADERPQVALDPVGLPRLGNSAPTAWPSLAAGFAVVVGLEDARLRLDHLAERPEGDALAVGQRAALAPGR